MIKIIKFFKTFQQTKVLPVNEKKKNSEFKKDTYKNFISKNDKCNSNI